MSPRSLGGWPHRYTGQGSSHCRSQRLACNQRVLLLVYSDASCKWLDTGVVLAVRNWPSAARCR